MEVSPEKVEKVSEAAIDSASPSPSSSEGRNVRLLIKSPIAHAVSPSYYLEASRFLSFFARMLPITALSYRLQTGSGVQNTLGLSSGVGAITGFIFSPVWALLSRRFGVRTTLAVNDSAVALIALVQAVSSVRACFYLRVLSGCFVGGPTAADSWALDSGEKKLVRVGFAGTVGIMVGMFLGALIASAGVFKLTVVSAITMAMSLALLWQIEAVPRPVEKRRSSVPPSLKALYAIDGVFGAVNAAFFLVVPYTIAARHNLTPTGLGMVLLLSATSTAVVPLGAVRLPLTPRRRVQACLSILVVLSIALFFTDTLYAEVGIFSAAVALVSCADAGHATIVSDVAHARQLSTAALLGVSDAVNILCGALVQLIAPMVPFRLPLFMAAAASVTGVWLARRDPVLLAKQELAVVGDAI